MVKPSILGIGREAFFEIINKASSQSSLKFPAYQSETAYRLSHTMGLPQFSALPTVPKSLQNILAENFTIDFGKIKNQAISFDGTKRCTIQFGENERFLVETVLIPEFNNRNTLCVSSQIGCSLSCSFCHTGTQKLIKNLSAAEILGQVINAAIDLGDIPFEKSKRFQRLSNVVFMGQGEPLYNWSNVSQAIQTLTDADIYGMSPSRITISTSGISPLIPKVADLGVKLAVSLHAPNDDLRSDIMDINKTYPLASVIEACKEYLEKTQHKERITMEYVMLRYFNDSERCAQDLARLLDGMNVFVNLM